MICMTMFYVIPTGQHSDSYSSHGPSYISGYGSSTYSSPFRTHPYGPPYSMKNTPNTDQAYSSSSYGDQQFGGDHFYSNSHSAGHYSTGHTGHTGQSSYASHESPGHGQNSTGSAFNVVQSGNSPFNGGGSFQPPGK